MNKCLVFFSGGKDSFLATCKVVENGYNAILISFNNGSVIGEENILHGVNRLTAKYGDRVTYAGVYGTAGIFSRLRKDINSMQIKDIAATYPNLRMSQIQCMCCQTSMWIAGIAFAKSRGMDAICTGYRRIDEFCTGDKYWIKSMKDIAQQYNIGIILPEWGEDINWDVVDYPTMNKEEITDSDFERDNEMLRRQFLASVLEPKCTLGLPANRMNIEELDDMHSFFNEELKNKMVGLIDYLIPVFNSIKLTDKAFDY